MWRDNSFIQNSVLLHAKFDFFHTFNLYVVKYQIYCRDGSILPTFYQRDDSLALHDVISSYVSKYVSLYYGLFDFITTISYSSTFQCHKVIFTLYTLPHLLALYPTCDFWRGKQGVGLLTHNCCTSVDPENASKGDLRDIYVLPGEGARGTLNFIN